MKQIEKLIRVNFKCDECGNDSGFRPQPDSADFKGVHPYPYEKKWLYVYEMKVKLGRVRIEILDGHFCSEACLKKKIKTLINRGYKTQGDNDGNN